MAFRPLLRRHAPMPLVAAALVAGTLYPTSTLHAEAPPEPTVLRKPIYDDVTLARRASKTNPPPDPSPRASPTPTDRVSAQVRRARLFVYAHSVAAEDSLNAFMSSVLRHERSFTQTIAALAPPTESRERLVPGGLYVLVAAMAGSIVSRNRNILLRASVPAVVGFGAARLLLPVTTRNVADLVWTYEERVPVIALNHLRIRGFVEGGWDEGKRIYSNVLEAVEEGVKDGREAVEGWVSKGK